MNKKVTNLTIKKMKQEGTPISMITAYDYIMAQNVDEAGIDMILVGDSLGNVVMALTASQTLAPPSSLTASQPVSFMRRPALCRACWVLS